MVVDPSTMMDVFLASALLALLVGSAISLVKSKFSLKVFRLLQNPLRHSSTDSTHDAPDLSVRDIEALVTELRQASFALPDETCSDVNAHGDEYAPAYEDTRKSQIKGTIRMTSPTVLASFLLDSERYLRGEIPSNVFGQASGLELLNYRREQI